MRRIIAVLILMLCAGNAVPRDPGLVALQALDLRLATVGHRLAIANQSQCPRRAPQTGLILHSLGQYAPSARAAMARDFAASRYPSVQDVVPGSAAAKAGLQVGDALLSLNGVALPSQVGPKPVFTVVDTAEHALDAALTKGTAHLTLQRGRTSIALDLRANLGCLSRFQVMPSGRLFADATGRYVQVSSAIMDAARDEDELAFVVAHEMAHNILAHPARLKAQGRTVAMIRATEIEADEFGLKLMHGAGYDVHAAARFWARIGEQMDSGIFRDGSHLSPGKRVVLLRAIANRVAP
jgi:beta-barrel assembly-enhancing protease